MIIHILKNWGKPNLQQSQVFIGLGIPKNLDLFPFGTFLKHYDSFFKIIASLLCHNLSCNINLVRQIKHIQASMICKISKIHLFFRSQSQFDYMLALFSGYSGHSSHQLINVHLTVGAISSHSCVCHHFSNIFHGIRPIIWRQRPRFSHRINMPYISDWGWSDSVTTFQIWINLFLSNKSEFTKFGIKYKTWEVLLGCNSL